MDIGLTDEQRMLRDTVSRLADDLATVDPNDVARGDTLDAQWRQLVEMGVPTLRCPDLCGLAASGVESAIVIEELAKRLCSVPALGQAIMVAELLTAAGADKELELVGAGDLRLAPVLDSELAGFGGAAGIAFDTAGATHALHSLQSDEGMRLVYSPLDGVGNGLDLTRRLHSVDSDLTSAARAGEPIGEARWAKVAALALTAVAADLVGVMTSALDDAVRYAGERSQFGVRIGSFQAIGHLLADALIRVEGARSCLWHAAWAVDHLSASEALLSAMTAKAYASEAGRDVVETAVQVFGGIAITWEHVSHLRVRRMLLDRRLFGDEAKQYDAIAAMRLADEDLT